MSLLLTQKQTAACDSSAAMLGTVYMQHMPHVVGFSRLGSTYCFCFCHSQQQCVLKVDTFYSVRCHATHEVPREQTLDLPTVPW